MRTKNYAYQLFALFVIAATLLAAVVVVPPPPLKPLLPLRPLP